MSTPTIERTMHMAFGIGLFERMPDAELVECFKGGTAEQIRAQLAEYREQGFQFVPCSCGNYDERGACKGALDAGIEVG